MWIIQKCQDTKLAKILNQNLTRVEEVSKSDLFHFLKFRLAKGGGSGDEAYVVNVYLVLFFGLYKSKILILHDTKGFNLIDHSLAFIRGLFVKSGFLRMVTSQCKLPQNLQSKQH